jgi:predicted membrane chloride channel (bestrophin family)
MAPGGAGPTAAAAAAAAADVEAAPAGGGDNGLLRQRPHAAAAAAADDVEATSTHAHHAPGGWPISSHADEQPQRHGNLCCAMASQPTKRIFELRPNVVTRKTRRNEWRQLQSRWRWFHSFFFSWGPPSYLMSRIWPVVLINMALAVFVCIDHVLRALPYVDGQGQLHDSFLPNIADNVQDSLTPMTRFTLFAASMLLTLRLGRVYERWFMFRQSFSVVGSTATGLSQRVSEWVKDEQLAADVRRWAIAWHYAVMQVCQGEPSLHPEGAKYLTEDEMEVYRPSRKGRQLCVNKLVQLIADAREKNLVDDMKFFSLDTMLQNGASASGRCVGIKFQCLPLSLTLVSTGFIELFLLTLVLMLLQQSEGVANVKESVADTLFTVAVVLAIYFGINLLFLGSDEVANQLEDPSAWLPLREMVETTERDVMRVPAEMAALRRCDELREKRSEGGGRKSEEAAMVVGDG